MNTDQPSVYHISEYLRFNNNKEFHINSPR